MKLLFACTCICISITHTAIKIHWTLIDSCDVPSMFSCLAVPLSGCIRNTQEMAPARNYSIVFFYSQFRCALIATTRFGCFKMQKCWLLYWVHISHHPELTDEVRLRPSRCVYKVTHCHQQLVYSLFVTQLFQRVAIPAAYFSTLDACVRGWWQCRKSGDGSGALLLPVRWWRLSRRPSHVSTARTLNLTA